MGDCARVHRILAVLPCENVLALANGLHAPETVHYHLVYWYAPPTALGLGIFYDGLLADAY